MPPRETNGGSAARHRTGDRLKYSRFEILAMGVAACAVLGTSLLLVRGRSLAPEIVGQLLVLVALFAGLHFGRRGAIAGFLASVAVYGILLFTISSSSTAKTGALFALRVVIYAIVAFVGGELHERYHYLFVKLEHHDYVDNTTSLYNSRYLSKLIERQMHEFDRYGAEFSLTSFMLDDNIWSRLSKGARGKLIKDLGNSVIKGNIRGADEAARVSTGKFTILFPNTDFGEATCATIRVKGKITSYMDNHGLDSENGNAITTEILEYPRDRDAIEELTVELSRNPTVDRA
jgi:GGDEF domain-containing protein